jgi:hypothetical protein
MWKSLRYPESAAAATKSNCISLDRVAMVTSFSSLTVSWYEYSIDVTFTVDVM